MPLDNYNQQDIEDNYNLKEEILKYLFFWRWFVLSVAICLGISLLHLRYSPNIYSTTAKIEVLSKETVSLDLPSASDLLSNNKINLENEIELLSSYPILNKAIQKLNLSTSFYSVGNIITTRLVKFPFVFEQLILSDDIQEELVFEINFNDNGIEINDIENDTTYLFNTHNTYTISHNLPFNISWDKSSALSSNSANYELIFSNTKSAVNRLKK